MGKKPAKRSTLPTRWITFDAAVERLIPHSGNRPLAIPDLNTALANGLPWKERGKAPGPKEHWNDHMVQDASDGMLEEVPRLGPRPFGRRADTAFFVSEQALEEILGSPDQQQQHQHHRRRQETTDRVIELRGKYPSEEAVMNSNPTEAHWLLNKGRKREKHTSKQARTALEILKKNQGRAH